MEKVSTEHSDGFDSMVRLRELAAEDLQSLQWTQEDFTKYPSILVLLFARAIGFFDLIRIGLEHGYGVRSRNLIRSLIDIEIDAALLSTEDKDLLFRYGAYEALELARKAEHGLKRIVDEEQEAEGVEIRRNSLKETLENGGLDVPDGFDERSLGEAADITAKRIFDRPYPSHWRWPLKRHEWLPLAVEQLTQAVPEGGHEFGTSKNGIQWEIEFAYAWCSEAVHVSPRSVAESTVWDEQGVLTGFVLAGQITEIPASIFMAMLHFVRLRLLVSAFVDFGTEDDPWIATYQRTTSE